MRLPPWAIEALRQGAADVARKASDDATLTKLREQAAELFRDLPENASRGLDAVLKSAGGAAKEVVDQGREVFRGWSNSPDHPSAPCLNATGILLHPWGSGVPVAETTLQPGVDLLRGDYATGARAALDQGLAETMQRGDTTIAVANNLHAALQAVTSLAGNLPIALHRRHAISLPSGMPLPDAFVSAGVRECGGVQSIDRNDYESVDQGIVVFADDGTNEVDAIDFGAREITTVAVIPIGTVKDQYQDIPSAEVLLRNGIDLVVLPGGTLTGGVDAGLLVGKRPLLETIQAHASWPALAASDAVAAITLDSLTSLDPPALAELLETSTDNLRSRAERMATRLGAVELIEAARITDDPAQLALSGRWQYPSRQLRIRYTSRSTDERVKELLHRETAILAVAEGEELVIDFRWLPPSADAPLGDLLAES
ncbi:MAG: hypothetical protein AAFU85_01885 [Planctomycetota bacterium]